MQHSCVSPYQSDMPLLYIDILFVLTLNSVKMLKRATGFPITNNQLVYPKLGIAEFHKGIDPKNFIYETVYLSFVSKIKVLVYFFSNFLFEEFHAISPTND